MYPSKHKSSKIPGISLIIGSALDMVFMFLMLILSFFMGGSTGPPNFERSVPLYYVAVIGLGFCGAAINLAGGIISVVTGGKSVTILIVAGALLGIAGSVSFYMLELTELGNVALLLGIVPPAVFFLLTRILHMV